MDEERLAIAGEVGGRTLKLSLGVGLCCCMALVRTAGAMPFFSFIHFISTWLGLTTT
jgi:hypothetical protein